MQFMYGNKAALSLWDANWDQLVGKESRKSAPDEVATQAVRTAHLYTTSGGYFQHSTRPASTNVSLVPASGLWDRDSVRKD